ncbi:hypothetical protein [Streptomyces sp. DSM 40750]|uniref:hypothetical protein n=1 Tax=Streptomyces sp. DSM 40750 TaxID=2801030 RepID=UPI00214B1B1D|nr:hypothetical protein [Streptomyces sp. DSM 40750]UUU28150.1 hypothetical protein JIX55_29705 [Streptomyces sp. DSM 40750]
MAFGADELRVLRRALALALNPGPASAEEVQDCLRLAESVDEAAREDARLRAFLLADLARYRAALPGTVTGYAALLKEALDAGYAPHPDDLAALRALHGHPAAAALLARCRPLVGQDVRARFTGRPATPVVVVPASRGGSGARSRLRLTALPGGLAESVTRARDAAGEPAEQKPARPSRPAQPADKPGPVRRPDAPDPARRPIPTPGEVFPPKRKPAAPPGKPPQQLAAV